MYATDFSLSRFVHRAEIALSVWACSLARKQLMMAMRSCLETRRLDSKKYGMFKAYILSQTHVLDLA